MEEPRFFSVRRFDNLAVVTFSRPPINMLSFLALGQLEETLTALRENAALSVVVLTGGVPGYFAAHADVEDVGRMENGLPPVGDPDVWDRVGALLADMPQLTVAAVNGQAWGGGCELALACDLLLLSQAGHLRLLEVSKGAIPGAGGTQRLSRRVGVPRALRMILSAELLRGDEALRCGLADALLPEADFPEQVRRWLAPILAQPAHAVQGAKAAIVQGSRLPLEEGLLLEKAIFQRLVSCEATRALGVKSAETLAP